MDAINQNNHGMITRSKRKKQNTPNLILQVTTAQDLDNADNQQLMELSRRFFKRRRQEKFLKKRLNKVEDE